MDNRLDSALIGVGKGGACLSDSLLSTCSAGLVTPASDDGWPPALRPDASEMAQIKFMQMRADAFDRNELDPDVLRRLVADLKSSQSK